MLLSKSCKQTIKLQCEFTNSIGLSSKQVIQSHDEFGLFKAGWYSYDCLILPSFNFSSEKDKLLISLIRHSLAIYNWLG